MYRLGLGAEYAYAENTTIGVNYELVWMGEVPMYKNRGNLAGELSGDYEKTSLHFVNVNVKWRF
ncbi:MAG: hypothetical protein ABFR90_04250 [Planctomycetota bacterium]